MVVFRVPVVVAVFGCGGFDVVADDAEEANPAGPEGIEGAPALADGGLGESDDEKEAVAFWGEAEGVVADEDGCAVDDDIIVFGAGFGEEAVGDGAEEVFGGMCEWAASGEEVEVFDVGWDDGGAPRDLLGQGF
jgi:hypothetical protein